MSSTSSKLVKMDFQPGIRRESTQYAETNSWYDTNNVRFRAGKPENIGGYETKVSASFNGSGRDLITWTDNDQFKRAMFGTAQMLYEHSGDEIFDVTPVSSSASLTNAFSVAVSTNVVTVSATAHGRQTGDFVFFTSTATIGGNILLGTGTYQVNVNNANTFNVSVATTASAAQSSSGNGHIHYLLNTGVSNAATGLGYGSASYQATVCASDTRAWNQPTSTGASDFSSEITQWSLDNWGEDIVANRRKGSIYYWDTDASTTPLRATKVSGSTNSTPTTVDSIIVSPNDRHLIALGGNEFGTTASPTGTYNPLTVRWSNQEDYTNWVPSISSTSGEVILADGTKIKPWRATDYRYVALSRDLIARWGGPFEYGDYIVIEGTDGWDGIYQVRDTMNPKWTNRVDILTTISSFKYNNITMFKYVDEYEVADNGL